MSARIYIQIKNNSDVTRGLADVREHQLMTAQHNYSDRNLISFVLSFILRNLFLRIGTSMLSAFGKDYLMGRALLQHCFNGHRQNIMSLEVEKKARRHNTSDKF